MKIGILTFHDTVNYGATLQAYALLTTVKKIIATDSSVEIIDYKSKYISRVYVLEGLKRKKGVKGVVYQLSSIPFIKKKIKSFEHFDSLHMRVSDKSYSNKTLEEIGKNYDVVIAGSDQIFNGALIKEDLVYLLKFGNSKIVKMTYAASLGNYSPRVLLENYGELIKDIDYISLRENQDKDVIEKELGKKVSWVLDPTLLLKKNEWSELEEKIVVPHKYVLVYLISPSKEQVLYIKHVTKKMKCPVVYIPYGAMDYHLGMKCVSDANPGQFLYLINQAEYIITNSFHGTVLSVNYGKNFSVIYKHKNHRVESILEALGMEEALQNIEQEFKTNDFDYGLINEKLKEKRGESMDFLKVLNEI